MTRWFLSVKELDITVRVTDIGPTQFEYINEYGWPSHTRKFEYINEYGMATRTRLCTQRWPNIRYVVKLGYGKNFDETSKRF